MLPRRHFIAGAGLSAGLSAVAGCASAPKSGAAPGARNLAARGAPLDAAALEDALVGSSYLGCGGGGSLAEARALIAEDLAAGRNFRMISVGALGDEERIACPYVLASLAPMSEDMQARLDAIG